MIDAKVTLTTVEGENRQFVAQSGSGHAVVIDDKLGNTGAKPIELVLMGLGGCTAFDVIGILRKKRQKISSYHILLSAEQKQDPPSVFTRVKVKHVLAGIDISPKAVEDAIRLSESKYCSVGAMISKTALIDASYEIRNERESSYPHQNRWRYLSSEGVSKVKAPLLLLSQGVSVKGRESLCKLRALL